VFKPALGELLAETLAPIAERLTDLKQDSAALDAILARGSDQARELAAPTLAAAYEALGLIR
jgi:tryptophanyl-tRNA synthetase